MLLLLLTSPGFPLQATASLQALEAFYMSFPEYKDKDLYIVGESYGGKPCLAQHHAIAAMLKSSFSSARRDLRTNSHLECARIQKVSTAQGSRCRKRLHRKPSWSMLPTGKKKKRIAVRAMRMNGSETLCIWPLLSV